MNPVCVKCQDYAPVGAITCPGCGYWPLREPTKAERLDRELTRRPVTVTTNQKEAA